MKVLIIGASGRTGRYLIQDSLALGHTVTAFIRHPADWPAPDHVRVAKGEARDRASLDAAVKGQDAVLSAFGAGSPRFWARRRVAAAKDAVLSAFRLRSLKKDDIMETMMRNLVDSMVLLGVKRVVTLLALGVGDSAKVGSFLYRAAVATLQLKGVFEDKARGEEHLFASPLDYVNVRPGRLTNAPARGGVKASLDGKGLKWEMTRADLSKFMVAQLTGDTWVRKSSLIGY